MDISQVIQANGKPVTQGGKAVTIGNALIQALNAHARQLPAYQAFVTLAKADLIARIEAGNEIELSQAERALLFEIVGDSISAPAVLAQVYEALQGGDGEKSG